MDMAVATQRTCRNAGMRGSQLSNVAAALARPTTAAHLFQED
jgi:hypothetical protein